MKTIAILGPTASGKTALSIDLALEYGANILSLDSLSLYKEIDIASAKPTLEERRGIAHFGMDVISPNEHFDVTMFFDLYHTAQKACLDENKNLIIVGGTGFYLKMMMEGLSHKPILSLHVKEEISTFLQNLPAAYELILKKDKAYAGKIASNDKYRIEKWLEIFLSTNQIPSEYLALHKAQPILENIELFEIETPKEVLKDRIIKRTKLMLKDGLVDEIFALEKKYTRSPNCMGAIGIKEVLDYFDGKFKLSMLEEKIATHTAQLAKRQRTFNTSQFPKHPKEELGKLKNLIETSLHVH